METKDYVYLGLMAVTAAIFYWHGYLAARSQNRARKTAGPVLTHTPRRGIVEFPMSDLDSTQPVLPVRGHRIIRPAGFRKGRIRAVFGVN